MSVATDEEGVATLAGAWLGDQRGALLMHSSGVGNSINRLPLNADYRLLLRGLLIFRGKQGECNPQQIPMGRSAQAALEGAGVHAYLVGNAAEVAETVRADYHSPCTDKPTDRMPESLDSDAGAYN